MIHDLLFFGEDHYRFVERRKHDVLGEIESLSQDRILGADIADLTNRITKTYQINVPVLRPEQKTGEMHPVKIDISQDSRRLFYHTGIGPSKIDGTRISINVPFDGDPELFAVKPPTHNLDPPRGEVIGNSIVWHIEEANVSDEQIAAEFDFWLKAINQHLEWHRQAANEANRSITAAAHFALMQRVQKFQPAGSALAKLGIYSPSPVVRPSGIPVTPTISAPITSKQFDCFVSYAREDRSIVMLLVDALMARSIHVWWDKGQITIGDRLSEKIDDGLSRSRYGLVIVSPSFVAKKWPNTEIRALLNRAVQSRQKVILPVLVNLDHNQFAATYPLLADIVSTTFNGDVDSLVDEIITAMI